MVAAGLHHFMYGLIDYAGLFPPACLDLPGALGRYRAARESAHGWMLARFICPAAQLREAVQRWEERAPTRPLRLSALAGSPLEPEFSRQVAEVAAVHDAGRARIELIELKLPSLPDSEQRLDEILVEMDSRLDAAGLEAVDVFVETAGTLATRLIPRLAGIRRGRRLGFKLRCGGTEASAFPSVRTVQETLISCVEQGVPFKATAGLHHPVRHSDAGVGVVAHGFLNIFMAGMLCALSNGDAGTVRSCLEEQDPGRFHFGEESAGWADQEIPLDRLRQLRADLMSSFGSCSFREPVEDLHAMSWLSEYREPPAGGENQEPS